MNSKFFLPFLIILTCCCNDPAVRVSEADQATKDTIVRVSYSDSLELWENQSISKSHDHLGEQVKAIEFSVADTAFSKNGGVRRWVSLEETEADIAKLREKDIVVIENPRLTLIVDYPLRDEFAFQIFSQNGFTRRELIELVSQKYHDIYAIEEETSKVKTIPPAKRVGMYNRNLTKGKFGIWGHDLSDLVLSGIRVYQNSKGQVVISLDIES